jgi:chorismate synthase
MLCFMTAGESHGPTLVAVLDGIPAGLALDVSVIDRELERRQQGFGAGPRMKLEKDTVQILGGVMGGLTTGAPLALMVTNSDHANWRGKSVAAMTAPRPGHADLTGAVKYGFGDLRPALERSSARETAARVAVGAVCKHFLAQFGVQVGGYVTAIGIVSAELGDVPFSERLVRAEASDVRCPDEKAAKAMRVRIEEIIKAKDTLGGVLEIVAMGIPVGLGSYAQWDQRLEARLGAAVLSVQAIKGVEIGPAFENAHLPGTQVHDAIKLEGDALVRPTDRSGGTEGGISTGQTIVIRAAMKPIATTLTPQSTVDLAKGTETPTKYERSDYCPVPRAVPVLEAMVAFVLADALIEKLGGDSLAEMRPRFDALRQARLEDLHMDNTEHVWWPE